MKYITYKNGDLTEADETVIIHGCNCFNTMGSGVALALRKKWPGVAEVDSQTVSGDRLTLGKYTFYYTDNGKLICNAYTQYMYGTEKKQLDEIALYSAVRQIVQDNYRFTKKYAIPRIGCGLAGGDWNDVQMILFDIAEEFNVTFVVYEL